MNTIRIISICVMVLFHLLNVSFTQNYESEQYYSEFISQKDYKMFQQPNNVTNYIIKELDQFDTGYGIIHDIQIVNDLAFTVAHRGGLLVFNISDYSNPVLIGTYDDPKTLSEDALWTYGLPFGLDIKGDLVFLGDGLNGMLVLNVTDPTNPQKIGHYKESGVYDIIISGDLAFESLSIPGLQVLNISDPTNPYLICKWGEELFEPGLRREFVVKDNYLYVMTWDLIVFDISNITQPIEIERKEDYGGWSMNFVEDHLFVFSGLAGTGSPHPNNLTVFDTSNPSNLISIRDKLVIKEIDEYISNSLVYNNTLFLRCQSKLYTYNFDGNYNLTLSSTYNYIEAIDELAIKKYSFSNESESLVLFCSNRNKGLQMFDYTNTSAPYLITAYDLGSQAKTVFVDEQYIYLTTQYEFPTTPATLFILEHNIDSISQLIGSYTFDLELIRDICVYDGYAYIAGYNAGLLILNVTTPTNPTLVTSYEVGPSATEAIQYDPVRDFVFMANYGDGFSIVDVQNKTHPILLHKSNHWGMSVVDVFVDGELLFLAGDYLYGGVGIVNISNPTAPIFASKISLSERVFSVYAQGNLLYFSTDLTPLYIYDVTQPASPHYLGELYTGKWFDGVSLQIQDNLAYLAREGNGLMVIDVEHSKKPKLLVEYRDYYAGISYDVSVHDGYIFLADGWDGVEVLELIPPKIFLRDYLLMTILPPVGGVCLVIAIVVIQFSKKRKTKN
jgi:hypothetical protein